ncbi:hypothetical protein DFQ26_009275 [Actinomortierella ambigua]|nr:hypothetical protein DFQ26_009275 [Actinomortierella ambigua]
MAARALAIYNGRDASRSMAYKLRGLGLVVPAATQPASNLTHHIKAHLQSLHTEKLSGTERTWSRPETNPHVKALSKAIGAPGCLKKSPQGASSTINTHIR